MPPLRSWPLSGWLLGPLLLTQRNFRFGRTETCGPRRLKMIGWITAASALNVSDSVDYDKSTICF